jgi:hypothetical protein
LENTSMEEHNCNPTVEACQGLLQAAWAHHNSDTDILILSDMGRQDTAEAAGAFWKLFKREPPVIEFEGRTWTACLQPARFLDVLARGGFAQREATKELRGFAAARKSGMNVVPLLFGALDGHWATMWSPPDSNVVPVRHEPRIEPDRN